MDICWLIVQPWTQAVTQPGQQRTMSLSGSMASPQETFWWHFWGPAFHYAGTGAYLVKVHWRCLGFGGSKGYPYIPLKGELRSYKECCNMLQPNGREPAFSRLLGERFLFYLFLSRSLGLKHCAHCIFPLLWIATVYHPRGLIYGIELLFSLFVNSDGNLVLSL